MGMGDGNPRYPLDINGDIRLTGAIVNSQGLALNMVNPDSAWAVDAANNKISYSAGNVGIGTTSPAEKLEVRGRVLIVENPSSSGAGGGRILGGHNDNAHAIHFRIGEDGETDVLDFHEYGKIRFYTNGLLAAQTEKMCILQNGNVGIGTTSPQAPLHIVDKDAIASASEVLRLQRGDSTHSDITTASKGSIGMYLEDSNHGGGEVAKIEWRHDGTNTSSEGLGTLSFWTSNTGAVDGVPEERMTIRASGNVGIGTTSPFGKLDIKHSDWTQTPTASTMCDMLNLMVSSPSTTGEDNMRTLLCFADGYRNNSATKDSYRVRCRMSGAGFDMIWNSSATETLGSNTSNNNFIFARDYTAFMNKNVGIGTTSPKSGLQVIHDQGLTISPTGYGVRTAVLRLGSPYTTDVNSIENYCAKITSTNNHSANYGSDLRFFTHPNGQSYSGSSNQPTERMCILGSGNVGIGTSSPDDKLHVQGGGIHVYCNSSGTGNDAAQGSNAGNANIFMDINNYSSGAKNGIIWKSKYSLSPNIYTKTSAGIYYQPEGNYFRGGLGFYTNGAENETTNATEKMRINMNGNVGIGTTTPYAMLDINRNNDGLPLWLRKSTTDTNPGNITRYYAWIGGGEGVINMKQLIGFGFAGYSTAYSAAAYIGYQRTTHGNHHSGDLIFGTRATQGPGDIPTERMRIAANGNVGIGTLTPSAKLDVNGSIRAKGIDGGNIGSKFLVTPVTDGTHNLNNVPSLTGAGNWLEYHPHVDFDFILHFNSPYQIGMQVYLKDKTGAIIQQVDLHSNAGSIHTTASSSTADPGYEGNNVALFVYNPDKKMYEFAYAEYWYNYGNNSTDKAAFNEVIDQALPTDMIVLNGTGYCSRWMERSDETEKLRRHFGSTESPYTAGWSSVQFAGIKGYGKILEFDTGSRGTQRAAAVKIGDIDPYDDLDYSVAWTSDHIINSQSFAQGLTSSDFCFMYNQYGGRIAKMKVVTTSNQNQTYIYLATASGNSYVHYHEVSNGNVYFVPYYGKMAVEHAGGTWPDGLEAPNAWQSMTMGNDFYWTGSDGKKYYFSYGNKHAGRRRYMVNGTRNRRDDTWPVGSTRGTNVEIRDTHLTIKKRTDKYDYGNQTRMIEFKPYMSDRWNNSGSEFQPYTVKASINCGISSLSSTLNTETGFIAFHTADGGILDERMRIEYNGHVGIGTTEPNSALCVNGSLTTVNGAIQIVCKSENYDHDAIMCKAAVNNNHIINFVNTSNSIRGLIRGNGTSGVTYETSSDRRLKENVIGMSNMIDKIMSIKCREFDWIQDKKHDFGFIAQEIYELFPHLRPDVSTYCDCSDNCFDKDEPKDKDGNPYYYGLDYGEFTPYLVKAFQELYEKEQEDKAEIAELKTEVATLKSELAAIKQHLGI